MGYDAGLIGVFVIAPLLYLVTLGLAGVSAGVLMSWRIYVVYQERISIKEAMAIGLAGVFVFMTPVCLISVFGFGTGLTGVPISLFGLPILVLVYCVLLKWLKEKPIVDCFWTGMWMAGIQIFWIVSFLMFMFAIGSFR